MTRQINFFPLNGGFWQALFILGVLGCHACVTTTHLPPKDFPDPLPDYRSQQRIKTQGFKIVPTPSGPQPSVYFGYDRNQDARSPQRMQNALGIDVLEFKALRPEAAGTDMPF